MRKTLLLIGILGILCVQGVNASEVLVTENISTSVTWTSDNVYNLQQQIYVLPGASLTIEAGTLIQSTAGLGGSLAVCRGAKIYVNGTKDKPVIMTSSNDDMNTWHEGANEWGNLTIMGKGLISASHYGGEVVGSNTKLPTGLNEKQMEGLTASYSGDPNVIYGGNDDDDDSGSISYLSLRYGGKVIGLANELNGLSLGAVGRETDIDHVEVMNNVDDGIEIWGGTVNLKYVNIWNVGDDSLDVDEGWRGKAQFGLIVQGYSADASQGSGVGDNCFETDGAEDSDAQPVTTGTIYNFTAVGQPVDGDQGTAWRDNARVQYRNCIFMDLGEKLVKNDNKDGDGGNGYGYNGTLTWEQTWATDYSVTSDVNTGTWNPGEFNDPTVLYASQTSGKLAGMSDSVFYNNLYASAYTDAEVVGVLDATSNNVTATNSPIKAITRGSVVTKGGKSMLPVESINPLAINDATRSLSTAPNDGFFVPASYRGGFSSAYNWLKGWSAVDAYGMLEGSTEVLVSSDISTSTTWTSDNVYNLQKQIYVLPGASLTIEPGTVIQNTAGLGGSLAVCRGAKIYVNGTENQPVIMTSSNDNMTSWHEGANEWGNLTIMGKGLISASHYGGEVVGSNTKEPNGLNEKQMEGLTASYSGDPNVIYGGNDDDDDSGSISYLSLRYGGKVIGLANELNGLSLGAVGRETDIDHVEVMNNVDDGIEIWGGTVNLKYVNIWNVGDDSLDVDEGWRGKAQFGLIVQGFSADASQGSGVGDNCFETDGAEDSDAQPVTTGTIYNFTAVGQPVDGDQGTAWRDNARVQYRNCIFMDLGEKLVKNDNKDGDGGNGYGYNGTLTWEQTWATDYSVTSDVNTGTWNPGEFNDPTVLYVSQTSGKLAGMSDSVFYNNLYASAYTDAEVVGVLDATSNNVTATNSPIKAITRGSVVTKGGKSMLPVTSIDPRAWNDAVASVSKAADDGFYTPAKFRGGFPFYNNWLEGWTAAYSYGLTNTTGNLTADELGDVGSSSGTTITDALLIAQYVAGLRTADDPVFDNLAAGDVNGVGGITITDALLIAQYSAGLRDSLAKKKGISKAAASVSITPTTISVDPEVTGSFTIGIESGTTPVGAYDINLSWTPGVFTINSVSAGSSTEFGTPIANIDNEAGTLKITGFQYSSLSQPLGSFSVAAVNFTSGASGSTSVTPVVQELSDTNGSLFTPTASSSQFTVKVTSSIENWNLY